MKSSDPQLWGRIEEVFHAAVELPPSRRDAYLAEACGADSVLRGEVANLLSADAEAQGFLETPALRTPVPPEGDDTDTAATVLLATELAPSPARLPADFSLTPGEVLSGRFRVVRFLAAGGMGEVYEAEDLELGGRLALKTILRPLADDPAVMERFRREVHLARQVTHPSICRSFDIFHHTLERSSSEAPQRITFLTMELLRGETLRQRIQRRGPLTSAEALPVLRQVAEGLAAAHQAGVVHRDLKSSNVFLVGEGRRTRAVVTDFGLARLQGPGAPIGPGAGCGLPADATATHTGALMGTPAYMAPEQLLGEEITPATDIYAFGVVMYEMATGELPFPEGEDPFKRLTRPAPAPESLVEDLEAKWASVIRRSLRRRPESRYADGLELVRALQDAREPRPSSRVSWAVAALLLLLLVAAVAWRLQETSGPGKDRVVSPRPRGGEASRLFDEGLRRLRLQELPAARKLFGDAVALEPDVALVRRALGEAWLEDGYETVARDEAARAYDLRAGLPARERQRVEAFYHETMPKGPASLESAEELYRTLYDEQADLDVGLRLASVLRREGAAERALDVLDDVRPPSPGDPRVELEEVQAAGLLKDPDRIRAAAERGLARSSGQPWLTVRFHLALAEAWRLTGNMEEAAAQARSAVALAEQLGDATSAARARCLEARATSDRREAREIYEDARRRFERIGHPTALMKLHSRLGLDAFEHGSFQEAADQFTEAVGIARDTGHWLLPWYLYNLGSTLGELDRLEAARARYEEARTRAKELGARDLLFDVQQNLAGAQSGLGRLDEALVSYEEAVRLGREKGDLPRLARPLANFGSLLFKRGELAEAERRYKEASALETGEVTVRAVVATGLGYVALARGKLQEARGCFQAAIALRDELGEPSNVSESRIGLAEVELAAGHPAQAEQLARRAAEELAELKAPDKELRARIVLAEALTRRGRLAQARDALARAGGLGAASNDPELRLHLGIVEARLRWRSGSSDTSKLEAVLAQAQESGYGELALQARLALGEMALAAGGEERRARLGDLVGEAEERGFALIAARGRKALEDRREP